MSEERITRREVIKRAAYITPVILTFLAAPSFASGGSGSDERYKTSERDETNEIINEIIRRKKHRWNWDDQKDEMSGKKGRHWLWKLDDKD
jgi:hypothetical protein